MNIEDVYNGMKVLVSNPAFVIDGSEPQGYVDPKFYGKECEVIRSGADQPYSAPTTVRVKLPEGVPENDWDAWDTTNYIDAQYLTHLATAQDYLSAAGLTEEL